MVRAAAGIRASGFLEKAPMPEGRERTPAPRIFLTGGRRVCGGGGRGRKGVRGRGGAGFQRMEYVSLLRHAP